MYLEAVVVCVNYSDFLAHTLPMNRSMFDNMVVVTDKEDLKTKKLCEFYNVKCIQTDVFYKDKNPFNKGAAINEGLKHLSKKGWVLHMDADIWLPPLTRNILENLPLDENKIYGCDRYMCNSYEKWMNYVSNPQPIQEGWVYIHTNQFPIGVRLAEYHHKKGGWEPIGFWQLWNPKTSGVVEYPTEHGSCDRTDVLHAKKFTRSQREFLPEIIVIHLDSSETSSENMGTNWKGRKTPIFGPSINIEKLNKIKEVFFLKRIIITMFKLPGYKEIKETQKLKRKRKILRKIEELNKKLSKLVEDLSDS